jgi:hypothetical protein
MAIQSTVAHNSTHAASGADAITPANIGAVAASEKGAVNGIATLDASAKLAASQLPDLAISDFLGAVANEADMLAKTGQKGDWVTRSDDGKVYVITGNAPAQASSWTALSYPVASTTAGAPLVHGHGNLTNDGKVRVPYGGILSVSGVDAGSFSDGTFPIIQGDGVGGVITVLNGVISVTSAGSGYVDGLATKAGGSRYNLITQSTQNASANLPVITTTDGAVSVMSPDSFRAAIGAASSSHEHSINGASVDNAILRADGIGGATAQSSSISIGDAATTGFWYGTQNYVPIENRHEGQTNSALVLTPKGTGAFILGPKPDGILDGTGGDARGLYAIDLQLTRDPASPTQVASGVQSVCVGSYNTALSDYGVAIGVLNSSDLIGSIAIGSTNNSINDGSISIGTECVSEGQCSTALGSETTAGGNFSLAMGYRSSSDRYGQVSFANGRFAVNGDAQNSRFILRGQSTSTTARNLTLTGASVSGSLGIPVGKLMAMTINIAGISSLGAVAHYVRQYAVRNLLGTSTQVYAPVTIGTDFASGTSIALSVNDPDDTLRIVATGTSGPTYWRWVATIDAVEIGI